MHDDESRTVLPCGCVTEVIRDTFVLTTCPKGESCEWVQYIFAQNAEMNHPVSILKV